MEEEILKRIKYRVNELKLNYAIDNLDLEAMQGLLNLYEQQKEKVQEYEKQLDLDYVDKNYVKRELYEQEKEKNKKLEKEIIELQISQLPDTSETYKELKNKLEE